MASSALCGAGLLALGLAGCGGGSGSGASPAPTPTPSPTPSPSPSPPATDDAFLLDIHQKTFTYFWNYTNPVNGLCADRSAAGSVASIAACGFAMAANVIGSSRGYVSRAAAAQRTLATLTFFANAPQGAQSTGVTGYQGFFYHFLDMTTGQRAWTSELSIIDTALLVIGALIAGAYFNGTDATETQIRTLSQQVCDAVNWPFALRSDNFMTLGWTPENGYINGSWAGFNESQLITVLAIGSSTNPVPASVWTTQTGSYDAAYGTYKGQTYIGAAPLFIYQYPQAFIDMRDIRDAYMRGKGFDYFENATRATLAQRQYAIDNPQGFAGYGANVWGLTACDGPGAVTATLGGVARTFQGYAARGTDLAQTIDDGTIAPTAAIASINFTPVESYQAMTTMNTRYGSAISGPCGFYDAFNPSFVAPAVPASGSIVGTAGWVDSDYLGIDQGAILLMLENYSSGLIWQLAKTIAPIKLGLQRAGFQSTGTHGTWLT